MRKFLWLAAVVAMLSGCAQGLWNKPGSSQDDFNSDRYACLQNSQQQSSAAFVNKFSGSANSGMTTNGMLFDACMNSKGWSFSRPAMPGSPTVPASNPLAEANKALTVENEAMCTRPDLQKILEKSACDAAQITLPQLADQSFLSEADKLPFSGWRTEVGGRNARGNVAMRKYGGVKGAAVAVENETSTAHLDQASLALYTGKITWGQYNQQRKEIARVRQESVAKALAAR